VGHGSLVHPMKGYRPLKKKRCNKYLKFRPGRKIFWNWKSDPSKKLVKELNLPIPLKFFSCSL